MRSVRSGRISTRPFATKGSKNIGRSKFVCDDDVVDIAPGSLLFVAKDAVHRFFDIEEDLQIIVVFAPEHRVKNA